MSQWCFIGALKLLFHTSLSQTSTIYNSWREWYSIFYLFLTLSGAVTNVSNSWYESASMRQKFLYAISSFDRKSLTSAAYVPSCGLRNIKDRTQHDRRLLRRSLLAATTAMIAAAEVTTISSLSAISTSPNLCFRYHVTAKYSAAPAKVVAENGDKVAISDNICCRFWRQYLSPNFVAVFCDFCRQCGQAFSVCVR